MRNFGTYRVPGVPAFQDSEGFLPYPPLGERGPLPYVTGMSVALQHETMRREIRRTQHLERKMGEVIRFVSKSERERIRLIRDARAIYDSIFPSADPEQRDDLASGTRVNRNDGGSLS